MLHTNFQGHRPFGSGEDFLRFLPYIGVVAILVMWPGPFEQTFVPPSHGGSIWNLTLIGQAVSEEKMFKECGRRRTDNGAYLYYKLTHEPKGSGELKIIFRRKSFLKAIFIQIIVRMVTRWSTRLINTKKVDMSVDMEFLHNFTKKKCIFWEKCMMTLKIIKCTKNNLCAFLDLGVAGHCSVHFATGNFHPCCTLPVSMHK